MYMKRLKIMFVLLALTSLVTSCGSQKTNNSTQNDDVSDGEDNSNNNSSGNQSSGDNGSNNNQGNQTNNNDTPAVTLDAIDYVKVYAKKSRLCLDR